MYHFKKKKKICLAQIVAFVFDATTVSTQCSNDAQLSNDIVCGIYGELGIPDEKNTIGNGRS